ncbi:putative signal transduction protein with CBS domain containing protein [Desulfovibrio sp. X2]|uniref:KpsF/GutQ family sugar-phosphate isomerase n=1 Tax=Desulfovibrio sp. X2 TaxID=941449 RepID=UPI000358CBED|nr:KpsF/GutQ family sugar-phosphate isomerase [Desulfovibrio sp. X2]EPR42831.1 putative signal transduction protein with CBS domain containing protein [Desulfovibrio sp. X2]
MACECRDWGELGREVVAIEIEGLSGVAERLDGTFSQAVELLAACQGRVVVTGIGKSGLVGRKIAATFSSTGTPAYFLHPVEGAHGDLGIIRPGDVVLAISNSGETDELNAIIPTLKSLGVSVIAMTGRADSTLACMADLVLDSGVPREACPHNLAPTASTTAQLALGDALAVCLIERKEFREEDFQRCHPGGALGRRLSQPVTTVMHADGLPVAAAAAPLSEALRVMNEGKLGFLAVTGEGGRLEGVFTDGDVRRLAAASALDLAAPVESVMTRGGLRLTATQTAAEAMDLMETREVTVLPIVDCEDRLVGMVHLHDLLGKGSFRFSA